MARINVRCEVREYPEPDGPYDTLVIRNHWNWRDRVVFEIGGKSYTFVGRDVKVAIDNATNTE